jgi:hypothetical protein
MSSTSATSVFSRNKDRRRLSLSEFAEQFERIIEENKELETRLRAALDEKAALQEVHDQLSAKFDCETSRLNLELTDLRTQVNGRLDSLMSVRERLMKDEFERKFQELTMEVKGERNRYGQLIEKMKTQLSACICRPNLGRTPRNNPRPQ